MIQVENVSKTFGTGDSAVVALRNVSFAVDSGEFVSVVGPSGCGKSTLLRLMADLLPPTEGRIALRGKTPQDARLAREYGFVFQSPTLYQWRTVRKNVQLPLEIMGVPRGEWRERVAHMLEMVGLADFHEHYPWQLSGGMQQRVSIARALAFDPPLLLMDEPFGALDEFTRERLNLELLKIWQQTHKTIIFVTHSIAEAVFLSTRVVVMSPRPGQIAAMVPVDLSHPRTFETRESERFFELVTRVRETLREELTG